jgi:histidine triad (HIT) family protein
LSIAARWPTHSEAGSRSADRTQEFVVTDTIFSKIVRREIPADIVYEDDDVLAFRDLNPQAPVHVLFIPKRAIATLDDAVPGDVELLGKLLLAAAAYARAQGLAKDGYRTVINTNTHGGQTVFHIHVHLLAGRQMHWPPG